MWPYVNNRLFKQFRRQRHQRQNINKPSNLIGYFRSKCELEVRYFTGHLITKSLSRQHAIRNTKFIIKNKLNQVASYYSRNLNPNLDYNALITAVEKNDKEALHTLRRTKLSLLHPCRVCGGHYSCVSGNKPICSKADLSIRQKMSCTE